jgi:hypothetical protein
MERRWTRPIMSRVSGCKGQAKALNCPAEDAVTEDPDCWPVMKDSNMDPHFRLARWLWADVSQHYGEKCL